MVYRVCVEKKPGLAPECASLLSDCRSFLDLKSLENVRIWNRYDVEGIDETLFAYATNTVFSEPQLDLTSGEIDASGGAVFFAAGVFYYCLTPQVKALVCAMAEAFPGGKLVFDAANRKAVKLMLKTWLKDAEIKDVGAYFDVTDARRELSAWSDRLRVSSRGYMLGYNDLRNQNVRKFFRFLSKVGDGMMNMQIVRLDFAKENKKHE